MPKKINPELRARAVRMVTGASAGLSVNDGRRAGGGQAARAWSGDRAPVGGAGRGRRRRPAGDHLGRARRDQAVEGGEPAAARRRRHPQGGDDFLRGRARLPQPLIMAFIDDMRAEGHAVESTCRVLREQGCPVAARTYRAWRAGRRARRSHRSDARDRSTRSWPPRGTPEGLYGRRKMTHHLRRAGHRGGVLHRGPAHG